MKEINGRVYIDRTDDLDAHHCSLCGAEYHEGTTMDEELDELDELEDRAGVPVDWFAEFHEYYVDVVVRLICPKCLERAYGPTVRKLRERILLEETEIYTEPKVAGQN